tara:strand:+ start:343 stop:1314 length:972 start_codon:yes stop_codon:yes gene_type:complete
MYSIVATKPGDISVLQKQDLKFDDLKPNQVLIKNNSIGVNFIDIYFRAGLYPWPQKKNLVLGSEAAGEVEAVGIDVKYFKKGDRVAYAQANNAYATHRVIDENLLVSIPDSISFDQAAAAILKGLTVKYLVHDSFKLKSHHKVLFHAAAGGVGLIAGQWIKEIGSQLIGTVGSEPKCIIAKKHGYDEVINYTSQNFQEEALKITNNQGVDVVYDSVGKDTMFDSFRSLKKHGTLVSFGQSSGMYDNLKMSDLMTGSLHLTRPTLFHFYSDREWLKHSSDLLFNMIAGKKISFNNITEYSLNEVAIAHTDIENRKTTGSVILKT